MTEQLTLIPRPPAKPLTPDQHLILTLLARGPRTAYELQTGMANEGVHRAINSIGTRLSDLAKLGKVRKTGEKRRGSSPRKLDEWRLV